MIFLDPIFYLFVAAAAAAHAALPRALRPTLLLFLWGAWLVRVSPTSLLVLLILSLWVWGSAWLMGGRSDAARRAIALCGDCGLVAAVLFARLAPRMPDLMRTAGGAAESLFAVPEAARFAGLVGLSYAVLRAHHLLFLARTNGDFRPRLRAVVGYMTYLPSVTSGPVLRWREHEALGTRPPTLEDLDIGSRRVVLGLFKKTFVVGVMRQLIDAVFASGDLVAAPLHGLCFSALVYFDFSGYSDIAVGIGRFFGHDLPENFKRPYLATSISHLWRLWHASLGDWLREHLFAVLGGLRSGRGRAMALTFGVMLFVGLWHGFEFRWAAWGMYMGALMAGEIFFGIRPLPPDAPAPRLWRRRILVLALCGFGGAAFLPQYWRWVP